jgi:hypothetical protein
MRLTTSCFSAPHDSDHFCDMTRRCSAKPLAKIFFAYKQRRALFPTACNIDTDKRSNKAATYDVTGVRRKIGFKRFEMAQVGDFSTLDTPLHGVQRQGRNSFLTM